MQKMCLIIQLFIITPTKLTAQASPIHV